jgi:hypothetical protein
MFKELVIAFGIMAICVVIHVIGMVILGEQLVRHRAAIERRVGPAFSALFLMAVFTIILALHSVEAGLWAAFYYLNGLFATFETCLYFSFKTYSTVGYGDVLLSDSWRVLGTVEAISGVLLCGLSTAFLFTIMNILIRFRVQQLMKLRLINEKWRRRC